MCHNNIIMHGRVWLVRQVWFGRGQTRSHVLHEKMAQGCREVFVDAPTEPQQFEAVVEAVKVPRSEQPGGYDCEFVETPPSVIQTVFHLSSNIAYPENHQLLWPQFLYSVYRQDRRGRQVLSPL